MHTYENTSIGLQVTDLDSHTVLFVRLVNNIVSKMRVHKVPLLNVLSRSVYVPSTILHVGNPRDVRIAIKVDSTKVDIVSKIYKKIEASSYTSYLSIKPGSKHMTTSEIIIYTQKLFLKFIKLNSS